MSGKKVYYWDTCLFIAWLKNEKRDPGQMEGLQEAVDEFESDEAVIVTTIITKQEVLPGSLSKEQQEEFSNILKRKNMVVVEVTPPINDLSIKIRDFYYRSGRSTTTISVPDAIHLATAIIYKVDVFQTFDGAAGGGLLQYDGNIAGHDLKIKMPFKEQQQLNLKYEKNKSQKGRQKK